MILIVGDPEGNRPTYYQEAQVTAQYLKVHGYKVKELYNRDATSENILKGMYDAWWDNFCWARRRWDI